MRLFELEHLSFCRNEDFVFFVGGVGRFISFYRLLFFFFIGDLR